MASDANYHSSRMAPSIARRSGFGDLSAIDIQRLVSDKVAVLSSSSSQLTDEFAGKTSPKDFEAFLQLLALQFTSPRRDSTTFQTIKSQLRSALSSRAQTPATVFADSLTVLLANNNPRLMPMTKRQINALSLDESLAAYRARFNDGTGFIFIFTGNLDLANLRPLVEKYIGGLRASNYQPKSRDVGFRFPTGIVKKALRVSERGTALSLILFRGEFSFADADRQAIRTVRDVLQMRLQATLREQLGAAFAPQVSYSYEREPRSTYSLDIQFASAPERSEESIAATFAIIADLSANGPTNEELAQVRVTQRQVRENDLRDNTYWATQPSAATRYGPIHASCKASH